MRPDASSCSTMPARRWRLRDCALMYGLSALAVGLVFVFAGGIWNLGRLIAEGELDIFLAQPKPVFCSAIAARALVSGWGDIASGLVMIALAGYWQPLQILLIVVCAVCAMAVFAMSGVIVHSAGSWLGPANHLARQFHEFVIMFSLYPGPIYTGWLRVAVFTIIPAGFISTMPVSLIRDTEFSTLLYVLAGTTVYCALGIWIFNRGLRRYESGSRIVNPPVNSLATE